jgi:hypothetical protein
VKGPFQGEQRGGSDADSSGDLEVPNHRVGAKREGDERGKDRGRAITAFLRDFAVAIERDDGRKGGECETKSNCAGRAEIEGYRPPGRTEHPGQRMGAQAGSGVVKILALLPASLDTDQQSYGESDGEALERLKSVHGRS